MIGTRERYMDISGGFKALAKKYKRATKRLQGVGRAYAANTARKQKLIDEGKMRPSD